MAEYIEREELIARLQKVCVTDDTFGMGIQFGTENAINCIKEAPAADVVEVVRCKECKWCVNIGDGQRYCMWHSNSDDRVFVLKEYFCSYGERRTEDAEI